MVSLSAVVLAIAISFDSFLVGLSYGFAGIKVPLRSLAIPGLITGAVMAAAMRAGDALSAVASPGFARWLGSSLIILIGAYALSNGKAIHQGNGHDRRPLLTLSFLGIILHVIRDSRTADMDRSSVIDSREATVLGFALALDAFGVGLGASLAGFRALEMTLLAGLSCPLSLAAGVVAGNKMPMSSSLKLLPSWTLIAIGLLRFL